MYPFLCRRFPAPLVDVGYMLVRALLIVIVVICSDVTLSTFQYVNF